MRKKETHKKLFTPHYSLQTCTGFTLIEFMLYIGLIGILVTFIGAVGLNVLFGKAKLSTIEEVGQNARFSLETIIRSIENAESIVTPTVGATSSTLTLVMASTTLHPTVFDLSSSTVRREEGSGGTIAFTSGNVVVSDLSFSNVSYAGTPGTVRIEMTIALENPENRQEYEFEKTFYTSATVRERP